VQESTGTYKYDQRAHELHWTFDLIDNSSSSGNIEFTIPKANAAGLFPIRINFKSTTTLSGIEVSPSPSPKPSVFPSLCRKEDATHNKDLTLALQKAVDARHPETKAVVRFSQDISFSNEEYVIV